MPARKSAKTKSAKEVTFKDLDYQINYKPSKVRTTNDISPFPGIIGQDKAVNAIKVGLNVKSSGYNIFVTGLGGTGRTTTIKYLLKELNKRKPKLKDICYVNNFKNDDCPGILTFEAGEGSRFKKDISYLVNSIRKAIPKIFLSEDYKERRGRIIREFEGRQKELVNGFEDKLTDTGFVMVQIQSSVGVRNDIQPGVTWEVTD